MPYIIWYSIAQKITKKILVKKGDFATSCVVRQKKIQNNFGQKKAILPLYGGLVAVNNIVRL